MTDIQKLMLKEMLDWDSEYSYPYSYFEGIGIDIKTLKKEMRDLISSGLVKIWRGGIDEDDGHVMGGTGFAIDYERRDEVEKIVSGEIGE